MKKIKQSIAGVLSVLTAFNAFGGDQIKSQPNYHLSVDSGWFNVPDANIDFDMTYSGWDLNQQKRIHHRGISPVAIDMINHAQKQIVMSTFLFDTMYGQNTPEFDVVKATVDLFLKKKQENPDIKIIVVLDSLNRSYGRRVSPAVQTFIDNGIDVFYTDTLATRHSTKDGIIEAIAEINRVIDRLTGGLSGSLTMELANLAKIPGKKLDTAPLTIETGLGAALIKANHRKILVTDVDGTDEFKALVTSANPHNSSDDSTNISLSVKGEVAKLIYGVIREDALASLKLESGRPLSVGPDKYAFLSSETKSKYGIPSVSAEKTAAYMNDYMPAVDFESLKRGTPGAGIAQVKFTSEGKIRDEVIRLLDAANPDDEVKIQMFYLSEPKVIQAIIRAAQKPGRTKPIRLLLDPNKDAFNSIKDGSPNRQVAHYLLKNSPNIEIRWYATHGEQNHAKLMTIVNSTTGKNEIIAGSSNWTRKNMDDVNMETNLTVAGSARVVGKFNTLFEKFWNNTEKDTLYSLDYSAYDLKSTRFINAGFKVVKEWDQAQIDSFIAQNRSRIAQVFVDELTAIKSISRDMKSITEHSLEQDKTALLRIVSLLVGQDKVAPDLTDKDQKKWENSYLKKWTRGEASGYVGW